MWAGDQVMGRQTKEKGVNKKSMNHTYSIDMVPFL